jgi:HEAT repeat protein
VRRAVGAAVGLGLPFAASLILSAGSAAGMEAIDEPTPTQPVAAPASPSSFAGRFGLGSIAEALRDPDGRVRAAAAGRAADVGARLPEGLARDEAFRLVETAAADAIGDSADASMRVRLVAARALAASPRKEARRSLQALLTAPIPPARPTSPFGPMFGGPVPPWGPVGPGGFGMSPPAAVRPPRAIDLDLARRVRETAALALAALGEHEVLLARARLRDDPEAARAATLALIASPAPSLAPLLPKGDLPPNREVVELLVRLEDPRAVEPLLRAATGKDDLAAAVAIAALGRLGEGRVGPIARGIAPDARPELRVAAADALAAIGDPAAPDRIRALARDRKLAAEASRLAVRSPSPPLVALIAPAARAGDEAALAALARAGAEGLAELAAIVRDDGLVPAATAAAFVLAVTPGDAAAAALSSAAEGAPAARTRTIVRAAAVRRARLGATPSGIGKIADRLEREKDPADRAAAALFRAIGSVRACEEGLASGDETLRRAALVALPTHADAPAVARAFLATHPDDPHAAVLAAIAARAVDGQIAHEVPVSTARLSSWLSADDERSGIAAYLLAARGGAAAPFVARALAAESLDVRRSALLGLAASPETSATGALLDAFRDLDDPNLRRAAARALVARADVAARTAFESTRSTDPDGQIRALASSGLAAIAARSSGPSGRSAWPEGREIVSVQIGPRPTSIVATLPNGPSIPILADDGGFAILARVAPGPIRIEPRSLAAPAAEREAAAP